MSDHKSNSLNFEPQERSIHESFASSCGKAILVGEHAVVYGAKAVAMPLKEMRMQVHLKPLDPSHAESGEAHLILSGKEVSERVAGVIPEAFELLTDRRHPVTVRGHSDVPIGAGLGSSASLCIASLRAIAKAADLHVSQEHTAMLGNQLETRFHGNPSGLDTAVVAYEQCIDFRKGRKPRCIDFGGSRSWPIALLDTGVRASTRSMIKIAEPYFTGPEGDRRLLQFDQLAHQTIESIEKDRIDLLSAALTECHTLLRAAGVVPDGLQEMVEELKTHCGCLAAKITGAGGGGTIFCLLNPENELQTLEAIRRQFSKNRLFRARLN